MFAAHMEISAAQHAGPGPKYTDGRNPMVEDTDTRFETESDVMELCDLAEVRVCVYVCACLCVCVCALFVPVLSVRVCVYLSVFFCVCWVLV